MDMQLLVQVAQAPAATLGEHHAQLVLNGGRVVHISSICRAMRRVRLSRQKVCQICAPANCYDFLTAVRLHAAQAQRRAPAGDDFAAANFWMELLTYYSASRILVGDETSKNLTAYWRPYAYGSNNGRALAYEPYLTRGLRTSALTYFSIRGFEDWRFTGGTYDAASWQAATDEMLLTPRPTVSNTTLASEFGVLILDGARIHGDADYLLKLRAHIQVKFIPPYRHELSPLDNGAYGWVVDFLKARNAFYAREDIRVGLNEAFLQMPEDAARHCFHNCRYYP